MKTIIKNLLIVLGISTSSITSFGQATIHTGGSMTHHAASNVNIKGDLTISGTHNHNSTSNKTFSGSSKQTITITGSDTVTFHNLTFKNTNDTIFLDGIIEVNNQLKFNNGVIQLKSGAVNANTSILFEDGATVGTGANAPSNNSHIEVPVKKTGDEAFIFPVGDSGLYRGISMTAPSVVTDAFTVQYHRTLPTTDGYDITVKEASIHNVSSLGYYDVDRTAGTSDVTLALYYDASEYTALTSECDLVVAHWDGSQWENLGNGGSTGTTSGFLNNGDGTGTICGNPELVTSFSPFALASLNSGTILPVELINFTATPVERDVHLSWSTATEINSDLFILEHSKDGFIWDYLDEAPAQGNSTVVTNYKRIDDRPFIGDNYYRLKQIDLDGTFEYSEVRNVYFDGVSDSDITLYPNPSNRYITIESAADELDVLVITDATGKDITSELSIVERGENHIVLNTQELQGGFYFVSTPNNKMLRFVKIAK